MRSDGDWILRIEDRATGVAGALVGWSLDIHGTPVHDIAGAIGAALPAGSVLVLTGCGRTEITTAAADGTFRFANLIDCVYRIAVQQPGFGTAVREIVLAGSDIAGLLFAPAATPPVVPRDDRLPASAQAVFVSFTTAGGAGASQPDGSLQYALDTATFDVDRLPLGAPLEPNDTDAFLSFEDSLTKSNVVGSNGVIDPPIGPNSRQMTLNIGMPVVGRSVQGDLRLSVGANP
jgi:hypothetical protein